MQDGHNGAILKDSLNERGCGFGKVNRERLSHVHDRVDNLDRRMDGLATNQRVSDLSEKVDGIAAKSWQILVLIVTQLLVTLGVGFWLIVNRALP